VPYIERELRDEFDKYLKSLIEGHINVSKLCMDILKLPLEKQDGLINYLLTEGLRHNASTNIMDEIIFVFYASEPRSYYKFERALGLLSAIQKEFKRREWTLTDTQRFFVEHEADYLYDSEVSLYEKLKIDTNGDLE
jgi:hypothetical protein